MNPTNFAFTFIKHEANKKQSSQNGEKAEFSEITSEGVTIFQHNQDYIEGLLIVVGFNRERRVSLISKYTKQ